MPVCEKCGESYQISREDERLVMRGMLAPVCDKCGVQAPKVTLIPPHVLAAQKKEEEQTALWAQDPLVGLGELMKAWLLDAAGAAICWVERPVKIKKRMDPLAKVKRSQLHVMVLSENLQSSSTIPVARLQTNITNFRNRRHPFWIRKVPDFSDGLTGHGQIEIPYKEVLSIKRAAKYEVHVLVTNGRWVKMEYLNPEQRDWYNVSLPPGQ